MQHLKCHVFNEVSASSVRFRANSYSDSWLKSDNVHVLCGKSFPWHVKNLEVSFEKYVFPCGLLYVPPWLVIFSTSHMSCKEWMSWGSQGRENFSPIFRWAIYWDPHDNEAFLMLIWIILLEFFLLLILLLLYYS